MYGPNRVPCPHKPAHTVIFFRESFLLQITSGTCLFGAYSYVLCVYRAVHCERSLATDNNVRKKTKVFTLLEKPITEI